MASTMNSPFKNDTLKNQVCACTFSGPLHLLVARTLSVCTMYHMCEVTFTSLSRLAQVALVTGGSSGIGLEIATQLGA